MSSRSLWVELRSLRIVLSLFKKGKLVHFGPGLGQVTRTLAIPEVRCAAQLRILCPFVSLQQVVR
jgi:hypothetical protein